LHPLQSAQESCIIVPIASILYCQIFHIAFNFNLLKYSALFQFLYGQIFILHPLQSAQELLHLLQKNLWADLPIALHPLQSAQEACIASRFRV
jgi:hypothetical protein